MNRIQKAEEWLRNYRPLKAYIENVRAEIRELENDEPHIRGVDFRAEKIGPTYKVSSETESWAVTKQDKILALEYRIKRAEKKIEAIERALSVLNGTEREIIEYRYFESLRYFEFLHKINMSERNCKYIRKSALKQIATALFGEVDQGLENVIQS